MVQGKGGMLQKHTGSTLGKEFTIFSRKENASNVAFVWNTLDAKDFMEYYPCDNYVGLVGD